MHVLTVYRKGSRTRVARLCDFSCPEKWRCIRGSYPIQSVRSAWLLHVPSGFRLIWRWLWHITQHSSPWTLLKPRWVSVPVRRCSSWCCVASLSVRAKRAQAFRAGQAPETLNLACCKALYARW
jgi:hypothetical protein